MNQNRRTSLVSQSVALLCLLLTVSIGRAAVVIDSPSFHFLITQNISYFEDTENQYQAEDFADERLLQQFTPTRTPVLRLGYTDSTLWLRVQIENQLSHPTNALIYVSQPNIGFLAVHELTADGMQLVESVGSMTEHIHGFVRHRAPVLRLFMKPGQRSDYLIEVRSRQYMSMVLNISDPGTFYQTQFKQQLFTGLALGALVMISLYGLFGVIKSRDSSYGYFALYALSIVYYCACTFGYFGYYWFPYTNLHSQLETSALILVFAASLQLSRKLFELHRSRRHLDRINRLLIAVMMVALVAVFFIDIQVGSRTSVILALLAVPLNLYNAAIRALDGFNPARIMVAPRLIILFIGVMTAQTVFGTLAVGMETLYILVASLFLDCFAGVVALNVRQRKVRSLEEQQRQHVAVLEAERRAKTEFLAQLSHEIRTPMNGILGMAELLEDSPLSPFQEDYVRTISASGNNLLKILDDILDYSKIETGNMTLDITSFDISTMLAECIEVYRQRAEEKGIELITHIHNDIPFQVKGDPTRIRQVIANILSNAIKFTDHGEVIIEVSPDPEKGPHHIRFSIMDTGVGMSRDQLQELFNQQRDHLESLSHHGLGLPISQQLVYIMLGEMGAESQASRGSTFWFSVPLEPDPDGQDVPLFADQLNGLHLLVVDDNASCRLVLQQQATSWGMKVSTAINGRQALAMLHNQATIHEPFDVVILDHEMPGMTGMELAARIKEDPLINNDPLVLMLTGLGMAPSATAARNAGIRRVISKPVTGRTLKVTLLEELAHIRRIHADHPQDDQRAETLSPMRILVAEDHHLSQKVVRGMLSRLGMQAVTVDNGIDAVKLTKEQDFDIILMDCEMPHMNGFDATRAIREWEQETGRSPIPIIALTAHIMDEHKERSLQCGMNAYLAKPIELSELRDMLIQWQDAHETSGNAAQLNGL
ncbi:MAG: hybrid sensor histidine kinase/response regulator [Ketobacter sp.]|nr:MAG: hybrid sensor histidine kinase/response regulator [Ketobacter sp.]